MTKEVAMNREEGFAGDMSPTGRKFLIRPKKNTALLCITCEDGKEVPAELNGMFTDPARAQVVIERHLRAMWDMNDAAIKKAERKAG